MAKAKGKGFVEAKKGRQEFEVVQANQVGAKGKGSKPGSKC